MKFKLGLALGFAAGYWWASTPDEERKARLDDLVGKVRDNPRIREVSDSVSRDARRLTDAAQARVTHAADRTSEVVADKVGPDKGTAPSTGKSSTSTATSTSADTGRKVG
jgi:hypothetical protein